MSDGTVRKGTEGKGGRQEKRGKERKDLPTSGARVK